MITEREAKTAREAAAEKEALKNKKIQLPKLENVVLKNVESQWEVAKALETIQTEDLYKLSHSNFDLYCEETFSHTRKWANDLVNWFKINKFAKLDYKLSIVACIPMRNLTEAEVKTIVGKAKKAGKVLATSCNSEPLPINSTDIKQAVEVEENEPLATEKR